MGQRQGWVTLLSYCNGFRHQTLQQAVAGGICFACFPAVELCECPDGVDGTIDEQFVKDVIPYVLGVVGLADVCLYLYLALAWYLSQPLLFLAR